MSATDWAIWAISVFGGGTLYTFLDPMVEVLLNQAAVSTVSLDFLTWMWNYGVLIIMMVAPTVWVLMQYQGEDYRAVR